MAENKTKPTQDSVEAFISSISDPKRREDSAAILQLMQEATGTNPVLWGSIVGFGTNHYKYESGREGDTIAVGFSPRKQALTVYGILHYDKNADNMADLGDIQTGKGCIYIKDLTKINLPLLRDLVAIAFKENNNV